MGAMPRIRFVERYESPFTSIGSLRSLDTPNIVQACPGHQHSCGQQHCRCHSPCRPAVNEALASFVEYKCVAAAFPDMPSQALFGRATSPQGGFMLFSQSCGVSVSGCLDGRPRQDGFMLFRFVE